MPSSSKYSVYSFYDYNCNPPIDFVNISYADEEDIERDGDNFVGSGDAMRLNCYDSLREAIKNAKYWPISITYSKDFSEEEKKIIVDTVNELVKDIGFCNYFKKEPFSNDITENNLIFK